MKLPYPILLSNPTYQSSHTGSLTGQLNASRKPLELSMAAPWILAKFGECSSV